MNVDISKATIVAVAGLAIGLQASAAFGQSGSGRGEQSQNASSERSQRSSAQHGGASASGRESSDGGSRLQEWRAMRDDVIGASELLRAEVGNGLNPVGTVRDLVLTPDGSQVQYVLFETSYPYTFFGAEDGFARYDGVEIVPGGAFDMTLRFEADDSAGAPEELELTRGQARARLVSRVLGESVEFEGEQLREIKDLLIDKRSGEIVHYVVETDAESLLGGEPRTLPADRVTIADDGRVSTGLSIRDLDAMQTYDAALL